MFKQTAVDVAIIGAGQAALSAAYYVSQTNLSYIIIGKEQQIGDTWRKRYDSLVLFTPQTYSQLPGMELRSDLFPTKDQFAEYLEQYAAHFQFPIQLNTEVHSLTKNEEVFIIETNHGSLIAKQVILATGPFQNPNLPAFATSVSSDIRQLHSSQYRNVSDLQEGAVLIVGGGNSGAQIAVEAAKKHPVYLSVSEKLLYLPLIMWKKSSFEWLDHLGFLNATGESRRGKWLRKRNDPIFGFELREAIAKQSILLKPRAVSGDAEHIIFADDSSLAVSNIVWATGFKPSYSFIHIPSILTEQGLPKHNRGVTSTPGLYFLGLPWQYRRSSALICGVSEDSKYVCEHIKRISGFT